MPKGSLQESRTSTATLELRDRLRQLEIDTGGLRRKRADVEALLRARDALDALLVAAEQQGLDVRAERGRTLTIDGILRGQAGRIVRQAGQQGGLAGLRARNTPPDDHWWWYLDVYVAQRLKTRIRRWLLVIGSVVLVLVLANYILTKFFGPTPEQRAYNGFSDAAESALQQGDEPTAIANYAQAVAVLPGDADAWSLLGALYERSGRASDAESAFASAEANSASPAMYWFSRGQAYLMLGENDRAYDAAQSAISADGSSAYAYYLLGSALDAQGKRGDAAQSFDKAAQLASDQHEYTLYAMARQRQVVLLTGGQ